MNFIDLFAGGGGLSEGFIRSGFNPIAHVEIDKNSCKTLETRLVYHQLKQDNKLQHYNKYILGKITREDFIKKYDIKNLSRTIINADINNTEYIFNNIDSILNNNSVDIIIGGPPCCNPPLKTTPLKSRKFYNN